MGCAGIHRDFSQLLTPADTLGARPSQGRVFQSCFRMLQAVSGGFSGCFRLFGVFQDVLGVFLDVSGCFRMFPGCFSMLQDVSQCFGLIWCFGLFPAVSGCLGCFRLFPAVFGCFRLFRGVSGCFRLFRDVSGCFRLFPAVSRVFQAVSGCFRTFQAVLGCCFGLFQAARSSGLQP